MMAFKSEKDREAYIGKLKSAGFSPKEIDADVAEIEASQPAPAPVAPPPPAQPNLQADQPAQLVTKLAEVAQARNEQNQDLTGQVLGNDLSQAIKDLSGSNLGKAGLAVGAGYGLYKAGRLAERKFGQSGEVLNRIEPTMEAPKESARLPIAAQQSGLSEADQALLAKSEANRVAKEQEAARRASAAPPIPTQEPPAFILNKPTGADIPPANAPKKVWEPPTASLAASAPALPTQTNALITPAVGAESVATTPATPVTTDAERVQVLKDLENPTTKETIEPTKVEPEKTKKPPKPEYFEGFKKLPGTERQLLGTLGVANNTERAKSLVNALKSTLPEGAALEFPKTEAGVSKGGMPNPQDVMAFTNKHLGTAMKLDETGKFPADFRYTEENLAKMHQSILDEYANAKTPSAKAAAEKGFATLRSLAGLAGFGALAYGSLEAYKHGKKTGDWTPAGELGLNTIAGAINPALMFGTHMTGLNAGEEQELAKRRYQAMVGGGRGIAPPSPRTQVGRR
jgi:hypothetical protein